MGREQEIFGSDRAMGESGVQQAWQRQPCAGHWHGGKPPRITQPTFSPQASLTSPSAQPGLILTRLFPLSMCRHREAKHTLGTGRCSSWKTQSITSRRSRLWKGGTGKPPGSGRGCGQAASVRHRASGHGAAGGRWAGGGGGGGSLGLKGTGSEIQKYSLHIHQGSTREEETYPLNFR